MDLLLKQLCQLSRLSQFSRLKDIIDFIDLVVLFVNTVTHRDDPVARSARREKRAVQAYASAEQHRAAGFIGH
jgi:hypothetical protein